MVEESFIGTVDSLWDVLYRLAAKLIPVCVFISLFQLRKEYLELISGQKFPVHPIVAAVQRNAVIPDLRCNIDSLIQLSILLAVVQLVFIGHSHLHCNGSFPVNRTGLNIGFHGFDGYISGRCLKVFRYTKGVVIPRAW